MITTVNNGRPAETSFIGVLRRTAFVAPNSFYRVLVVQVVASATAKAGNEITVTGRFGDLKIGQLYRFQGYWQSRSGFGNQFHATDYQQLKENFYG